MPLKFSQALSDRDAKGVHMKILLLTLSILTLAACGKKDDGGGATKTSSGLSSGVNFNAIDPKTGQCIIRTVTGVLYHDRGYIDIGGRQYTVMDPSIIDRAMNEAFYKGLIKGQDTTNDRFQIKIVAQAIPQQQMGPYMPTSGQYYGNTAPVTSQCNSTTLNVTQATVSKKL